LQEVVTFKQFKIIISWSLNNIEVVQDSDSFTLLVAPIKVQSSAWNSGTSCLLNTTLCVCVCETGGLSFHIMFVHKTYKQAHDANQQKTSCPGFFSDNLYLLWTMGWTYYLAWLWTRERLSHSSEFRHTSLLAIKFPSISKWQST